MNINPFDLSVSDFVAQSAKWCAEFNIQEDYPYDLKVEIADRALFDSGIDKYEQIAAEAEDWIEHERTRLGEALPMFATHADYIVRTAQWRDEFKIPKYLPYTEQVRVADEVLRTIDRSRYAGMISAAEEWSKKESANLDAEPPFDGWQEQIRRQLLQIQKGKYLMIYVPYGSSSYTIEQGTLTSVDWNNGTVLLHNTVYNRDTTVAIDNIQSIDESRSGSGALGSVQTADLRLVGNDWYRGNTKL
ncbi:hypothetical protein IV454_20855 [Massilia antarctica]|uniref:Uncharacterized protein n=1 Tax=Massilia antarctica TaxID=2765360 RepID=A0AA48WA96_9BURK|nr:hypothetical protein [Massilia antarctica]QPI47998.1 hypothetical protein IV454_20855 [Massilia antarctica]